jgi:hypothetical protein
VTAAGHTLYECVSVWNQLCFQQGHGKGQGAEDQRTRDIGTEARGKREEARSKLQFKDQGQGSRDRRQGGKAKNSFPEGEAKSKAGTRSNEQGARGKRK